MMALYRPFDDGNLATVVMQIANGEPNKLARRKFEECAFSAKLKALASADGLLNPEPSERTPLASVLDSYPLPPSPVEPTKEADDPSLHVEAFLSGPEGLSLIHISEPTRPY